MATRASPGAGIPVVAQAYGSEKAQKRVERDVEYVSGLEFGKCGLVHGCGFEYFFLSQVRAHAVVVKPHAEVADYVGRGHGFVCKYYYVECYAAISDLRFIVVALTKL